MKRRTVLKYGAIAPAALFASSWRNADGFARSNVNHLLPTAAHDELLIKTSFTRPVTAPVLKVGRRRIAGRQTDSAGRFWAFNATGLEASTVYDLNLLDRDGARLCDPWPLSTTPSPDASPDRFRLLIYTCAGGPDDLKTPDGRAIFNAIATRRRLLQRGLALKPDLIVGVGDQVYWDQTPHPDREEAYRAVWGHLGEFDEDLPVLGSPNEALLTRALDEQIAGLYGTDFRSVPVILTQDDHDYFENDEANANFITFPPRYFTRQLARATQSLYFPEFLADANRPRGIAGSRMDGRNESYGSWRHGRLVELLFYDCRRYMTLKQESAVFVEPSAERWLHSRTRADETHHLAHVPSTPMGWSAGKWGEWYPDVLEESGGLGTGKPKPYWQPGWFEQHQRLLASLAAQPRRIPLMLSGDLHASGAGTILSSGSLALDNPVHTVLSGPISTDTLTWPSAFRGTGAQVPSQLEMDERNPPIEKNGFTLVDFDEEGVEISQFAWDNTQSVDEISRLSPYARYRIKRDRS